MIRVSRYYRGHLIIPRTPDMSGCVWECYVAYRWLKADTLAGIKQALPRAVAA